MTPDGVLVPLIEKRVQGGVGFQGLRPDPQIPRDCCL